MQIENAILLFHLAFTIQCEPLQRRKDDIFYGKKHLEFGAFVKYIMDSHWRVTHHSHFLYIIDLVFSFLVFKQYQKIKIYAMMMAIGDASTNDNSNVKIICRLNVCSSEIGSREKYAFLFILVLFVRIILNGDCHFV